MKVIDIKGKDTQSIISSFRKEYRIREWELQYDIVSEASKGLFGIFGKKQAHVRFRLFSPEDRVKAFVERLLQHMQVSYEQITTLTEQKTLYLTIKNSSDAGFLIGKNGNMLEQLQFLVNRVFENVRDLDRIYLDTEDYRLRQEQAFLRNYVSIIDKVKSTGKPVTLDPMLPGERRIIHRYVESQPELKTLTVGEGDNKRIQILPAGKVKTEEPKARPEKKKEPARPKPELTPQQKAEQSYKRHNKAHPASRTSQRPRRVPREKTPRP